LPNVKKKTKTKLTILDYHQLRNDTVIMGDDMFICMASCHSTNNSGALVGNDSYDLECITQCSQRHTTLYIDTAEK
jgi:hypothetical protein